MKRDSRKPVASPTPARRAILLVVGTVLLGTSVGALVGPSSPPPEEAESRAAAAAPTRLLAPSDPSLKGLWIGLTLFSVAAVGIIVLSRRARANDGNGTIHLVDTLGLGGRRMVHLLRVDDRKYLIGNSERGIHFLSSVPQNEIEAEVEELAREADATEGEAPFAAYLNLGGRAR